MYMFVGNLPSFTTEKDLSIFARLPSGSHVRIIKRPNRFGGIHHYGLVYFKSERYLNKTISSLKGASCFGHAVDAREFKCRSSDNDPRHPDRHTAPWQGKERRKRDRRTPHH